MMGLKQEVRRGFLMPRYKIKEFSGKEAYGLVAGESDFFLAERKGRWAVYHKTGLKLFEVE